MEPKTTQSKYPLRATLRTIFQALVGAAFLWGGIVTTLGLDPNVGWVSLSLAITAGVTKVMAIPGVEEWLQRYLPFLSAKPKPVEPPV
jgi:hypothetical protein